MTYHNDRDTNSTSLDGQSQSVFVFVIGIGIEDSALLGGRIVNKLVLSEQNNYLPNAE